MTDYFVDAVPQVVMNEIERRNYNLKMEANRLFYENKQLRDYHSSCEEARVKYEKELKESDDAYNHLEKEFKLLLIENKELKGALQQAVLEGFRR